MGEVDNRPDKGAIRSTFEPMMPDAYWRALAGEVPEPSVELNLWGTLTTHYPAVFRRLVRWLVDWLEDEHGSDADGWAGMTWARDKETRAMNLMFDPVPLRRDHADAYGEAFHVAVAKLRWRESALYADFRDAVLQAYALDQPAIRQALDGDDEEVEGGS